MRKSASLSAYASSKSDDIERGCGTYSVIHEKALREVFSFVQRLFDAPSTADAVPFPVIVGKA